MQNVVCVFAVNSEGSNERVWCRMWCVCVSEKKERDRGRGRERDLSATGDRDENGAGRVPLEVKH